MLAPRPALLIYNDKDDCCFKSYRAKPSVYDPIVPFYRLLGEESDFEYHQNSLPGTHNYDEDNRQAFYRFIQHHFSPGSVEDGRELHTKEEIRTPEELYAGLPEDNANFYTLAKDLLGGLPEPNAGRESEDLRGLLRAHPMRASAAVIGGAKEGDLQVAFYRLTLDEVWTVPAVAISGENATSTVVAFADNGRAALAESALEQIELGHRVLAVDPLLLGEAIPGEVKPYQYAQMIGTVGERPLGIQVEQVAAVAQWAGQEFGAGRVSLLTDGWNSQVVGLCVDALYPNLIDEVVVNNGLASLKDPIETHTDYEDKPALFCFGLLKHFDVEDLKELAKRGKVSE